MDAGTSDATNTPRCTSFNMLNFSMIFRMVILLNQLHLYHNSDNLQM